MQAWEIAAELFENAVPKLLEEEEQDTHVEEKSNPFNPIGFVS